MKSTFKIWSFLFLASLVLIIGGYQWGGRFGLLWGFLLALSANSFLYFWGEGHIIRSLKGRLIEGQDPWKLNQLTAKIANRARIPHPRLYLVDIETPSAFALGRNWYQSSIILTRGIVDKFETREIEAIIAHEVAHIKRLDTFGFGVSYTLATCFLRLWPVNWFTPSGKVQLKGNLFLPFAWAIMRFASSKKSYLVNDKLAASFLDDPKNLADALWKLNSYSMTAPLEVPLTSAHMFIVSPLTRDGFSRYFHFQPQLKRRVKNLVGYFPL